MYPHERSLVEKMKDEPFAIVGVNSEESAAKLRAAMERERITWPSFFDGGGTDGPIATRWGVTGWPTIYVLDHEGVIRARDVRGEQLDAVLEKLVPAAREAAKR
jgi:hypothetical protein